MPDIRRETWELWGDLGQWREQRNGAARCEVYCRYRPVAPFDGILPYRLSACAVVQSDTEGCGSDTEEFRSAQLLQHARPAGQSGNADLPVVRCVQPAIAQALQLYLSGERNAFAVVHSLDGYDEISLTAEFKVAMPEKEKLYTPEMLGFSRTTEAELDGGETVAEAARIFDDVLNNRATPAQKNCVIANSAFAIQVICPEKRISECLEEAQEALESGKALQTFNTFISLNDKLQ